MSWNWLRVGHRIEWMAIAVFFFGAVLSGALGLRLSSYDVFVALIYLCLGAINTFILELPIVFVLVKRRRREAAGARPEVSETRKNLGRLLLYLLAFALTLVSAAVQVTNGFVPFIGSTLAVYLWNLGILVVLIGLNELWIRTRRDRERNQSS